MAEILLTYEATLEKEEQQDNGCGNCDLIDICYNNFHREMECYKKNYVYKLKFTAKPEK